MYFDRYKFHAQQYSGMIKFTTSHCFSLPSLQNGDDSNTGLCCAWLCWYSAGTDRQLSVECWRHRTRRRQCVARVPRDRDSWTGSKMASETGCAAAGVDGGTEVDDTTRRWIHHMSAVGRYRRRFIMHANQQEWAGHGVRIARLL